MALAVEVEAEWAAQPDIVAKLMPSARWKLAAVDMRPTMWAAVQDLYVSGRLRLSFPMQPELPIFRGIRVSFLEPPTVRSLPALFVCFPEPPTVRPRNRPPCVLYDFPRATHRALVHSSLVSLLEPPSVRPPSLPFVCPSSRLPPYTRLSFCVAFLEPPPVRSL